jgi:hypothetical protein
MSLRLYINAVLLLHVGAEFTGVFAWFMQGASQVLYLKAKLRRPTIGS